MAVESEVESQTSKMTIVGTSQPASANMLGSCGTYKKTHDIL